MSAITSSERTTTPTTLLELTRAWQWLEYKLIETGGEMDTELDQFYSQLGRDIASKVDQYDFILRSLDARADELKAEGKRFTTAANAMAAHRERLNATLKMVMDQHGITELQGQRVRFKLSNARPALDLDDQVPLGPYTKNEITVPLDRFIAIARTTVAHWLPGVTEEEVREFADNLALQFSRYMTQSLDREKVREALERGEELSFARLVPVKTLRVYVGGAK